MRRSRKPEALKFANLHLLLEFLCSTDGISRAELARRSGISPPTTSRLVDLLLDTGIVYEGGVSVGKVGRRSRLLHFRADAGVCLGVDIGGTTTRYLLADIAGRTLSEVALPTSRDLSAVTLAETMRLRAQSLLSEVGRSFSDLLATVVAVPGAVHPVTGIVSNAPNLPGVEGVDFSSLVRERLPGPVVVENDANIALIAEMRFGEGLGCSNVMLIIVGTGIGSAFALGGRLYRGPSGFAGEIGRMPFFDGPLGPILPAGFTTLTNAAAGPAVACRANAALEAMRAGFSPLQGRDVFALARTGDPVAMAAVRTSVSYLAAAIATYALLIDPERVVIAGGVANESDTFLDDLREKVNRLIPRTVDIRVSTLKGQATLRGTVAMATDLAYRALLRRVGIEPMEEPADRLAEAGLRGPTVAIPGVPQGLVMEVG